MRRCSGFPSAGRGCTVVVAATPAVVIIAAAGTVATVGVAIMAIEPMAMEFIVIVIVIDDEEDFVGVVVSFCTTENLRIMSLSSCDMMWQCQM